MKKFTCVQDIGDLKSALQKHLKFKRPLQICRVGTKQDIDDDLL